MTPARIWTLRIGLLLPAVLVVAAAVPRLVSGLALESAFPVPAYIVKNVTLPRKSYAAAAAVLAHADSRDGETQILRAEAAHMGGVPDGQVIPIVENGLRHDPASARGWTLLSELLLPTDRARAGKMLTTALELGPYDFFLAGRRARDGARLWDAMPQDGQSLVLRQARLLWTETQLRDQLIPLLDTPGGAVLMTRALDNDPSQIRDLNRWVARHRFRIGPQN
jgi:hypothetical protein